MPTNNAVDLSAAIGLPPKRAIEYFESKGYTFGFNWYDVEADAHDRAVTVAGVLKQDILMDIRDAYVETLKSGGTLADFKRDLLPTLEQKGWLGRGLVADEDGVLQGKRLTPRRLDTIFETNNSSVYNAGRYVEQLANKDARPYLEYVPINDQRTRPAHLALINFIAPIDDPIWQVIYPPNGYRCRCGTRARSGRDIERYGLTISSSEGRMVEIEQPWGNGETRRVMAYKNPVTGALFVPDAGFGHNPGTGYLSSLGQRLLDRSAIADPELASLAVSETLKNKALLNAISSDVKSFIDTTLVNKQARGHQRHVGALPLSVIDRLSERGLQPSSSVITLTDAALLHAVRDTKSSPLPASFWQSLPARIAAPSAVIYDTTHDAPALMFVFDIDDEPGKLVLSLDTEIKVRNADGTRERIKTNVIKTGKVLSNGEALKNRGVYEVLYGEL